MNQLYWVSTVLIVSFLLLSSYTYFFSKETIEGLKDLGFPYFFRIQLAILKIIAAIILIVPGISKNMKEWSYAGVAFFLITALVAHIAHKDSIYITILLFLLFGINIVSNYYFHRIIITD